MPPRRPTVADHADYYRDEALRMRAEAEKHAARGEFKHAGLALMVAQEAEGFFEKIAAKRRA